jgi:cyclin T
MQSFLYVHVFWQLIATVCMFLAGKVEDSPRPLQDVILMSYEIRFKKDPIAVQKIKQKVVV